MKLSISTAELLAQLQTVTRVASTRSAVQALSGVMLSAPDGSTPELLATDTEIGLRVPVIRRGATPGRGSAPRAPVPRRHPNAPRRAADARAQGRRAGRRADLRPRHVSSANPALRGFPDAPGALAGHAHRAARRGIRADGLPGGQIGVARRDQAGADRHLDVGFGAAAADGRHRLLPPIGQGVGLGDSAAERAGGEHTGARAAGAGDGSPSRTPSESLAVSVEPEPGHLRARRRRPVLAADRRAVSELPPAAAGVRRARAAHLQPRAQRRGAPHQPAGPEEHAAASRRSRRAS